MKTLIIVNEMSGSSIYVDIEEIKRKYAKTGEVEVVKLKKIEDDYSIKGYDKIIVCGGDGTIFNALKKAVREKVILIYFPYGTLNERSEINKEEGKLVKLHNIGYANETPFSYVYAAGTFTEIAYKTENSKKRSLKALAYLLNVIKAYRVDNIEAKIKAGDYETEGNFTLIMALDSNQCFRFKFNRAYRFNDESLFLLTIKSPGKDNLINRIKIFFPFFRVFFMGFDKDYKSKHITFMRTQQVDLTLKNETVFCVDGEEVHQKGELILKKDKLKPRLFIGRLRKKYYKTKK
ncbi:MAG: hypothetical protein K5765_00620 [Clostridia bacterium]|nr:hypothetical protein [Clostridia bacterium]